MGVVFSDYWWNVIVLNGFTARDWLENFRMSKDTSIYLCTQLSPALHRSSTVMCKAISVE